MVFALQCGQKSNRLKISRKHPSRDAISCGQKVPRKTPEILTSYDILESLKKALWASHDVMICSQMSEIAKGGGV